MKRQDITVGQLKAMKNVIGQVVQSNTQTFVIVDKDPLMIVPLFGTFMGWPGDDFNTAVPVEARDEQEAELLDKEENKNAYRTRWDEIARHYPAING